MFEFGLIGLSIRNSRAPALITLLGEISDHPLRYRLFEPVDASPAAFASTLAELQASGFTGCNVTYPFKQIARTHVQQESAQVRLTGATNTLHFLDTGISAINTDYSGFIRGFQHRFPNQSAGRVLILGAGGVGRAILFALQALQATDIALYDPNHTMALQLAAEAKAAGIRAVAIGAEDLVAVATDADGLVNCSPIGHEKSPGNPLPLAGFQGQRWAFDAVYVPLDTEFLLTAARQGTAVLSGFDLFLYQGLDAFEFWTSIRVDGDQARHAFCERFVLDSPFIQH